MEPSTYCLQLSDDAVALLARIEAELDGGGSPPITFKRLDDLVVFRCATWEPILKARVSEALMAVCGHDAWQRLFRPVA